MPLPAGSPRGAMAERWGRPYDRPGGRDFRCQASVGHALWVPGRVSDEAQAPLEKALS